MKGITLDNIRPHIAPILLFVAITMAYFLPLLSGEKLQQGDRSNYLGMSHELKKYEEATGKSPLWTNSMFGGMPAYQIDLKAPNNLTSYFHQIFSSVFSQPALQLIIGLFSFYILLISLGVSPWLAFAGAIAGTCTSYFFIILEAGHNTKAIAIAYMPLVIAGVLKTYQRKRLAGAALLALGLSLELLANHLQIAYYLFLIILFIGLAELISAVREKTVGEFIKSSVVLAAVAVVAVGTSATQILLTNEYAKETIRGQSELTSQAENKTSGLDKDYATSWSYGKMETFTLLIPNFVGGSSNYDVGENSATYDFLRANGYPAKDAKVAAKYVRTYWGDQPFTSGPVYLGAFTILLFVMGLFLMRGKVLVWIIAATVLSILLAWGRHFQGFTDFFLDYVPFYNKFRTVSMTLVIASFTIPLFAFLTLHAIYTGKFKAFDVLKFLKYSVYGLGAITVFFLIFGGSLFSFEAASDAQYPESFVEVLLQERANMLRFDAFRSLAFILLGAGLIWLLVKEKMKKGYVLVGIAALVLMDLMPVNWRHLNHDNFEVSKKVDNPFPDQPYDAYIKQDNSLHYRVFNATMRLDQDSRTSYHYSSLGGYHGAKLRRYQELVDAHLSKLNMDALNMLNAKYFIVPDDDKKPAASPNPDALGNVWFVEEVQMVPNADAEIEALTDFNPRTTAVVDERFSEQLAGFTASRDSLAIAELYSYHPDTMKYRTSSSKDGLAVFSEIYYAQGWNAYIDDELVPHMRANYVLRALKIPAGSHTVEFRFEPKLYSIGESIALASSLLVIGLVLGALFLEFKGRPAKPAKAQK